MNRRAVVGLGLIGGSVALACRGRGFDRDPNVRTRARARALDVADTLEAAIENADLVVLAAPTPEIPSLLQEAVSLAPPGAVLTDCASFKRPIVAAAAGLPPTARFVAGHPIAGGRGAGIEAADPEIFRGRPWVLVRTARTDASSLRVVEELADDLGARPIELDAERHDRAMTWVSHLPLIVSASLARATASGTPDAALLAGPGLLDTTRLAGQPSALGLELALAEPASLASAVDALVSELAALAAALRTSDAQFLRAFLEEALAARLALGPETRRT